jgi:hypothetical protein
METAVIKGPFKGDAENKITGIIVTSVPCADLEDRLARVYAIIYRSYLKRQNDGERSDLCAGISGRASEGV